MPPRTHLRGMAGVVAASALSHGQQVTVDRVRALMGKNIHTQCLDFRFSKESRNILYSNKQKQLPFSTWKALRSKTPIWLHPPPGVHCSLTRAHACSHTHTHMHAQGSLPAAITSRLPPRMETGFPLLLITRKRMPCWAAPGAQLEACPQTADSPLPLSATSGSSELLDGSTQRAQEGSGSASGRAGPPGPAEPCGGATPAGSGEPLNTTVMGASLPFTCHSKCP